MALQRGAHGHLVLLPQARRPLDVCEEERDGPRRRPNPHAGSLPRLETQPPGDARHVPGAASSGPLQHAGGDMGRPAGSGHELSCGIALVVVVGVLERLIRPGPCEHPGIKNRERPDLGGQARLFA